MRNRTVVGFVTMIGLATVLPADEPDQKWHTRFADAQAEAKRLDVPLLVHFYADWCIPCRRMDREVLKSPELLRQMGTQIVAVKLNSDHVQELVKRWNVRVLPSDVIIDPHGRVLARSDGYQDKRAYLARITHVKARYRSDKKVHIAKNSPSQTKPKTRKPAPVQPDPKSKEMLAVKKPETRIGLMGYSPVSLAQNRRWRKGTDDFSVEHKGITYILADEKEFRAFQSQPDRFAPRLLGCDPVMLWEMDRAIAGSIRYGAFYDGELYLFASERSRARFKRNPTRYNRSRHVLRPDQIERIGLR